MHDQDKLWDAGVEWDRAVKKLNGDQGRVARNNARKSALTALRKMRRLLDAEFPVIPKTVVRRRKPRTDEEKKRWLAKNDYVLCQTEQRTEAGSITGDEMMANRAVLRDCIALKVTVKHVGSRAYVPTWAMASQSRGEMREAKKSRNARASLAAHYEFGQRRKHPPKKGAKKK